MPSIEETAEMMVMMMMGEWAMGF